MIACGRDRRLWYLALVAAAAAGCNKPVEPIIPAVPVVRCIEPAEETVVDYDYFTGRTDAIESVAVRARV